MIYRFFKLFLDGTGLIWKNKWSINLKLAVYTQSNNYLLRLHQADNDSFAVLLRGLLLVIALILLFLSAVSVKIGVFKTMSINGMFTAYFLILYTIVVCSTKEEFQNKIKDISKLVRVCFLIGLILFFIASVIIVTGQYFTNPMYSGQVLNEKLIRDITVNMFLQIPIEFYIFCLLPFILPFVLLYVSFWFNRLVIFPVLRKFISKTLMDSPNEPFKILYFILLVWSLVKTIQSNIFK